MKKRNLLVCSSLLISAILTGCSSKESNTQTEYQSQVQETPINTSAVRVSPSNTVLENDLTSPEVTVSPTDYATIAPETVSPENSVAPEESAVVESQGETSTNDNTTSTYDDANTIDGYQLVDGNSVPVNVTITLNSVIKGEEAYNKLLTTDQNLEKAEEGMEYIIANVSVTYNSGEVKSLSMEENHASLSSACLYFSLSNKDSNAEDFSSLLSDSIYMKIVKCKETVTGQVAFKHETDSDEPLVFVGFDNVVKMNLN